MTIISPFPPESAGDLHRWLNSPRGPNFTDDAPSDAASVGRALANKPETFALVVQGKTVGFIGVAPASPVMAWFAGMVIAPEFRGRGLGKKFLLAVLEKLHGAGIRKASAIFFADNDAIRATFTSAGAVEEGYLRGAALRAGELVDMRLWSFNEGKF